MTVTVDEPVRRRARPVGAARDRRSTTRRPRASSWPARTLRELGRAAAAALRPATRRAPPRAPGHSTSSPRSSAAPRRRGRSPTDRWTSPIGHAPTPRAAPRSISVLVEPHWFGGSIDDLVAARAATTIPVLAKEFVVDPRQLPILRAAGADAVLLLAALHPAPALARLVRRALDLGLEPLVEVHDARELDAALATDARLIGVNNRDLRTLVVDTTTAETLRTSIPDDRIVIAESGVRDPALLRRWRALGFDARAHRRGPHAYRHRPAAVTARVAAFVAAGAVPAPAGRTRASDGRMPLVKICGVTEPRGLAAAIAAGADAIGLNMVPGTKRALEESRGRGARVGLARPTTAPGAGPTLVGIFADRHAAEVAAIAARLGLDAVQLHGDGATGGPRCHPAAGHQGAPPARRRTGRPDAARPPRTRSSAQAEAYRAKPNLVDHPARHRGPDSAAAGPASVPRPTSRRAVATPHPGHPRGRPGRRQRRRRRC